MVSDTNHETLIKTVYLILIKKITIRNIHIYNNLRKPKELIKTNNKNFLMQITSLHKNYRFYKFKPILPPP